MRPEQLQLGFLKVLNGSPMEAMANEYGIVSSPNPPYEVLFTPWLSYKEVLALKGWRRWWRSTTTAASS